MKKMGTVLLLAICLGCSGLDLILRNGNVLNNVTILNASPDGVSISANQGGTGGNTVNRYLSYADLTENSLAALRRTLSEWAKALNPAESVNPGVSSGVSSGALDAGLTDSVSVPLASFTPDTYVPQYGGPYYKGGILLPGYPRYIELQSILMLLNGTLGWAQSAEIPVTPGTEKFGRMYVYGVFCPCGASWYGHVYPTNKRIYHRGRFYPCYSTSIRDAKKINASVQY